MQRRNKEVVPISKVAETRNGEDRQVPRALEICLSRSLRVERGDRDQQRRKRVFVSECVSAANGQLPNCLRASGRVRIWVALRFGDEIQDIVPGLDESHDALICSVRSLILKWK